MGFSSIDWPTTLEWLEKHWEAVVATLAFFLTIGGMFATRRHNRLSVTPHLDAFTDFRVAVEPQPLPPQQERRQYQYATSQVLNKGIGPARVKRFMVQKDGVGIKDLEAEARVTLVTVIGATASVVKTTSIAPGWLMSPGETHDLLVTRCGITDGEEKERLEACFKKYSLWIEYESLYGKFHLYDSSKANGAEHMKGLRARWYAFFHRPRQMN